MLQRGRERRFRIDLRPGDDAARDRTERLVQQRMVVDDQDFQAVLLPSQDGNPPRGTASLYADVGLSPSPRGLVMVAALSWAVLILGPSFRGVCPIAERRADSTPGSASPTDGFPAP